MRKAVLLLNSGSPASTSTGDVRRYLREFLYDPRVLNIPAPLRAALLGLLVLPFRPSRSAAAYRRVWTPEGSPLSANSRRQMDALQRCVDVPVHLAMRYGEPSIREALRALRQGGVERMLLVPMYPHYAMSSYETAVARFSALAAQMAPEMKIDLCQPFYAEPAYIDALVASAKPFLGDGFHKLLFSFHGIPESHVRGTDPSHAHCLARGDCCLRDHPAHATCYRHQCLRTAERCVRRAGIAPAQCAISFQSRFGRGRWLAPGTTEMLRSLGGQKVGTLLVMTPSFVADCLESLHEIGIEGRELFQSAGGGEMVLVPCLNDHPLFVEFLRQKVEQWKSGLPG